MPPAKTDSVVLYPAPGIGHIISMVELGKLILRHHAGAGANDLSVSIFLTTSCMDSPSVDSYVASISLSHPFISFVRFPRLEVNLDLAARHSSAAVYFDFNDRNAPNFRRSLLEAVASGVRIKAAVIDMFCSSALPVARELDIPVYYFFTSGATALASIFFFPALLERMDKSPDDHHSQVIELPGGLPALKATEMPEPLLDRDDPSCSQFISYCSDLAKGDGILVNTFEELEPKGLQALASGVCVPGTPTPPVYCIGPLISSSPDGGTADNNRSVLHDDDLAWLDRQPSESVVFLCFGSRGAFSAAQIDEIAAGLERSGQRFFWVLKKPVSKGIRQVKEDPESSVFDLESILPAGFLERTRDRGRVVKSWAPQVEVLSKGSVGGFVTHCGWNSVLEAVVAGVPMIAWPLYAEQHLNRNILAESMKMAIPVEGTSGGIVRREAVETAMRELMEGEAGRELRQRSLQMKAAAREALDGGGSSLDNLAKAVHIWKTSS